jgi:hypothetical protein
MPTSLDRRELLRLAAAGVGAVFASGIGGCATAPSDARVLPKAPSPTRDFVFLHLSDTHWGFEGPPNPEAAVTLKRAVAAINAASIEPDFVVFTGDLTHTTDDASVRRRRLREFLAITGDLKVKRRFYLPGEHDAAPDRGEAFREIIGPTRWSFDHEGVHFVGLDNTSDPAGALGDEQLAWLASDLAPVDRDRPLVVLTHRPLFDLAPQWDWATKDGAQALALLDRFARATVLYGHVHQEHHHMTGRIAHHAARSLIFPLPAPMSVPKKGPLPWDPAAVDHGIGFRVVTERAGDPSLREVPLASAPSDQAVAAIVEKRCTPCHTAGGEAADDHDFSKIETLRAQRSLVGAKVEAGVMPPSGAPRPTDDEVRAIVAWAKGSTAI